MAGLTMTAAEATAVTPEALADVLRHGKQVLIVGSPPGTFDDRYRRSRAKLLFWPSTERTAADTARVVPMDVGAVLVTSMVSHALSNTVRRQALERQLLYQQGPLMSPGNVRRLLDDTLSIINARLVQTKAGSNQGDVMAQGQAPQPRIVVTQPQPKAAHPETKAAPETGPKELVQLLDEHIAGLQLIRERLVEMEGEFSEVKQQGEALRVLRGLLAK